MRALILTTVLLTSFGSGPLLAQDQAKSPPNASQPQVNSNPSATQERPSNNEGQKRRTLERMGPGIDWDHRKPGRDWKITPSHEGTNTKRE
jgi:hypothetical protein